MSVNPSHGNSGSSNGVLHRAVQQASNDSNRTSDQGPSPASATPESADALSATLNGTGSAPGPPAISGSNWGSNPTSNGQSQWSQRRPTLNGNGVNGTNRRRRGGGWFASPTAASAQERAERANRRFRGGARGITQQPWTQQGSEEAQETSAPQQAQPGGGEVPGVSSHGTHGTDATFAPVNGSNGHENGVNDHSDGSGV